MKTFNEINNIGNPVGVKLEKMPNYNFNCPDVSPKYCLDFSGTEAEKVLGQSCYMNGNMEGVNEDFEEVISLIK